MTQTEGGRSAGPAEVDTTVAGIARVYDAMLGGKDNFEVDRKIREEIVKFAPEMMTTATDGREWLIRVTRYLTKVAGINQFLDLGSGLPTAENTHQTAQRINPEAEVVYVDNDPAVLAHGRALLEENDRTQFLAADLTDPDSLLSRPEVTSHLDFNRPLALYQVGTLHHVSDDTDPWAVMERYRDALPSGSFLVLSHFYHPRDDSDVAETASKLEDVCTNSSMGTGWFRTYDQIRRFFGDLELLEPGIVTLPEWWPIGPQLEPLGLARRAYIGGVARKP